MFGFKKKEEEFTVDDRLKHIAFIMDGNGRWAKKRGLPREKGHVTGAKTLDKILHHCYERGIKTVTVYAFSTENWARPENEVKALMNLLDYYLDDSTKNAEENKLRYRMVGDMSIFPEKIRAKIDNLESITKDYDFTLNVALNYGGRAEIVHAFNELQKQGRTEITEKDISENIYTFDSPDPDLIIRTGGELRLSNFLLWQSAYSELYFTNTLWPDFREEEFDKALEEYSKRDRRYGKVK